MSFTTLPNTFVNVEYSIDLIGWVAYSGNPVNSSPTGSLVVTFTAPGDQTASRNPGMFFRAAPASKGSLAFSVSAFESETQELSHGVNGNIAVFQVKLL